MPEVTGTLAPGAFFGLLRLFSRFEKLPYFSQHGRSDNTAILVNGVEPFGIMLDAAYLERVLGADYKDFAAVGLLDKALDFVVIGFTVERKGFYA